jgi:polysaccharide export outer membrane protein
MMYLPLSIASVRLVLLAAALVSSTHLARAEYRLQAGDVVEISVATIPELKQRVPVQLDGSITFPLVGTLIVEGAPLSEIRSKIQSAVASKIFRLRTVEGREFTRTIERDEVAVTIVEYKPIFVSGDVTRPGEQAFRPRMIVRQALASAGGPVAPVRTTLFDASNLRSEYITVWLSLAREQARVWRIKTELGENIDFDRKAIPPAPLSDATISQIVNLEIEYRTTRFSDHERAKDFLRRSMQQADEQIKILSEQQQKEEEGVQLDTHELQKARAAFGHGNLPSPRVADARRAVLFSSTRHLQTTSQLMQVKKWRAELLRELEKIDDQLRIRLLAELQDAAVKLTGERAKLESVDEKLQLAGMRPPRPSDGASKANITVFRKGVNGTEPLTVGVDTELQPGDVVEVALHSEELVRELAAARPLP